jgi:[acyl-carrier-protein] S-malonyltransferase
MNSIIFPGQGSQYVGMCKKWYESFKEVKNVFNQADKILNEPLSDIIFNGPEEELTKTNNAQPAILISSIAILEVIKFQKKIELSNFCKFLAGHSLGEYTALYASNVLDFESVLKLVKLRGNLMSKSDKSGEGKMAAIIGLKISQIEEMLKNFDEDGVCEIANDNSEGQVVISGDRESVDSFKSIAKDSGAKLTIDLNVSAPFHCKLMGEAAVKMNLEIDKTSFNQFKIPVISNVKAIPCIDVSEFKSLLSQQITMTVKWRQTILFMESKGIKKIFEVGPGNVLSGLVKRITKNIECFSIQNPEDMDNLE